MSIAIEKDLRSALGLVRDQGARPTCVAFATSDAHAVVRGPYETLSAEHIYYNAIRRMMGGDPSVGVSLETTLFALQLDGQCLESGWPYLFALPANLSTWVPPSTARPIHRCSADDPGNTIDEIVATLDANTPVLLTMLLGERFYTPAAGVIELGAGDNDTAYHAMLVVGHGRKARKQYVLVRNSWGENWGFNGHAWIAVDYLQARLHKLARMEKVI